MLDWIRPLTLPLHPMRRSWEAWRYQSLIKRHRLPLYWTSAADKLASEIAFTDIFRQQQSNVDWVVSPIYSIGGAAHAAFLSILVRCLVENEIGCVFEFGAGQTTQILSRWSAKTGGKVFTFEDNPYWAERCRRTLCSSMHEIIHAPLRKTASGHLWYDLADFKRRFSGTRADLIILDGPMGTPRKSRAGFIDEFRHLCEKDWIVLWDDVHRFGDLESLAWFVRILRGGSTDFDIVFSHAFRALGLVFTQRYAAVKYYC